MEDEPKRSWTIHRGGGEPLPAPIAELIEGWLALTNGDPIASLVIDTEKLTLLALATSRGFTIPAVKSDRRRARQLPI